MTLNRIVAGALVLCSAAIPLTAVPAAAAIPSALVLTAQVSNEPDHVVLLTCDPAGGTHPDAGTVCARLGQVDGDPAKLPPAEEHRFCPMIFLPIKVTARGAWRRRPVQFKDTYANACVRDNKTGSLFNF
ncbi:SSI family serine proteinase inhibitor [Amycolatopsis sp. NPDC059090]|uniref:SSI family serine proteinase inhibitor n=1 Tax=unclassified Amycolatopsis TaxID=2618356 RepID=UPI00366FF921